ncbi:hypothetical protein EZS27_025326 [termite gut metagenome]|uniref:Uncharacterized protein n=1 Tax=termite gut metagenome TaxID=433724 RepID=A0A5J4QWI3_9ZZZZ
MKIVYNNFLPPRGFAAIMLFGVIFARSKYKLLAPKIVNYESIHKIQAKEVGGYFIYYLIYLFKWLKTGYRKNPFEREAYDNATNLGYLKTCKPFAWKKYEQKIVS